MSSPELERYLRAAMGDAYVPVRSGLGDPKPAGPVLSAERAQRLREDLDVLAAGRGRAAAELRAGGDTGE